MSTPNQFLPSLQPCPEIQAEGPQSVLTGISPTGAHAVLSFGSILLGLAEDGLPVILDLYDPTPGPLLVAGDGGSGKTALLQSLARGAHLQEPGDIQFGVLTPFPEEWSALETLPECLGVWPAYHASAQAFLSQLVNWSEALPGTRQAILLLFDGFDLVAGNDYQSRQDLRWLLTFGPPRRVWPVLTVNPSRLAHLKPWLEYFNTRLLGQVKRSHNARLLVDDPSIDLSGLLPGLQFGLSQPTGWLKFWLPPVE